MTLTIIAFSNYCEIYYGEDLLYKQNPISHFSKEFKIIDINFADLTHVIMCFNRKGQTYNESERYINMIPKILVGTYDKTTGVHSCSFHLIKNVIMRLALVILIYFCRS